MSGPTTPTGKRLEAALASGTPDITGVEMLRSILAIEAEARQQVLAPERWVEACNRLGIGADVAEPLRRTLLADPEGSR